MKKIILLISVLLCTPFMLAQTGTVVPTATQVTAPAKEERASESTIATNIDRRLLYLNRYKEKGDKASIESIANLVSERNASFYKSFLRYVQTSPIFTVKRDPAVRMIQEGEKYIFSGIMSLKGVDKKVSMTFIEEKSDRGGRWLLLSSNIHTQFPLLRTGDALASNALNKQPTTIPETNTTESKAITILPVEKKETPPTVIPPTINSGPNMLIIGGIALLCLLIISVSTLLIVRRRKAKKAGAIAALAATAASATLAAAATAPSTEITTNSPLTPTPSNVSVSTVEDRQKISDTMDTTPVVAEETHQDNSLAEKTEVSSPLPEQKTPEISPEEPEILETETPATEISLTEPLQEDTLLSSDLSPLDTPPEKEDESLSEGEDTSETRAEETIIPETETSVAAIFAAEEAEKEDIEAVTLDQIIHNTTPQNNLSETSNTSQPHGLFAGIYNPKPEDSEAHGLFQKMLKSGD